MAERNDRPQATIERMLMRAQRTPSWSDTRSWHATGGDETERLRAAMVGWAEDEAVTWHPPRS